MGSDDNDDFVNGYLRDATDYRAISPKHPSPPEAAPAPAAAVELSGEPTPPKRLEEIDMVKSYVAQLKEKGIVQGEDSPAGKPSSGAGRG